MDLNETSNVGIEGGPSHLEANPILFPSIPTLDVLSKPIIDPDDPSYILSPKSHDDPRNPLRLLKHRSHEDNREDQEEQRQWLEYIKNPYAIEMMDKAKSSRVEPKQDLDPKGELKSISLINITHPSLEEP